MTFPKLMDRRSNAAAIMTRHWVGDQSGRRRHCDGCDIVSRDVVDSSSMYA